MPARQDLSHLETQNQLGLLKAERKKTCNTCKMLPPLQWLWGPHQGWVCPTSCPMPGCSLGPAGEQLRCRTQHKEEEPGRVSDTAAAQEHPPRQGSPSQRSSSPWGQHEMAEA